MAIGNLAFLAFNRGIVSVLGLARADIKRISLSAEEMVNYVPRVLGAMSLRCGLQYIAATADNFASRCLSFIFSTTDVARIELTDLLMRVLVSDALITRPAVATVIANGDFAINLASWTDADEAGASSDWAAGGYMQLVGTGTNFAIRRQQVINLSPGVEHALQIEIVRGPVILRVGTSAGDDDLIAETSLATGNHSLALTPGGNFWVEFKQLLTRRVWIGSCTIEAAGVMEIPTNWAEADLQNVRFDQSGDVLFVACSGKRQQRIERRSTRSWSVVDYLAEDGPFRNVNTGTITMAPSVINGNGTLTASKPYFKSTHVGALFQHTSTGQTVSKAIAALNDATASIRVNGVSGDRTFTIVLSALTGSGDTVVLQRSFDNAAWTNVTGKSWTIDTNETYTDGLDNQIVYYRLLCSVYAGGAPTAMLNIGTGAITGICRITDFTSNTVVGMEVIKDFGATSASVNWAEGKWSDYRGWPSAVGFVEGRLNWSGKNGSDWTVSDEFDSFDDNVTGDSGPISRTIGSGPVDVINWVLALQRFLLGAQGAEFCCKSNSFDEPLSPTNANLKQASTQGSAAVEAARVDADGVFVQRGGTRVFMLSLDTGTLDYALIHLSELCPEIGVPGIRRIGIQRQPDTRLHFVRSDGIVVVCVLDKLENVKCWLKIETNGYIEDVTVLPSADGTQDDLVYYVVRRTINGATVRYHEKMALEADCVGGTLNKQLDAFRLYQGAPASVITNLGHLEGATVSVWGDGKYRGTAVVAGGQITVPGGVAVANAVVGLTYRARWKSGKLLMLAGQEGSGIEQDKNIQGLGLVMSNVHATGVRYGSDFDHMYNLPGIEDGKAVDSDAVRSVYDHKPFEFGGTWSTDSRICLESNAPKPATIAALVYRAEMRV